jgi:hypothetical protein
VFVDALVHVGVNGVGTPVTNCEGQLLAHGVWSAEQIDAPAGEGTAPADDQIDQLAIGAEVGIGMDVMQSVVGR